MKKDNRRSEIDNMPTPVLTSVGVAKMLSLMKGLNIIGDRVGDSKEEISAMVEPLIEFVEGDYSRQAAHLEKRGMKFERMIEPEEVPAPSYWEKIELDFVAETANPALA